MAGYLLCPSHTTLHPSGSWGERGRSNWNLEFKQPSASQIQVRPLSHLCPQKEGPIPVLHVLPLAEGHGARHLPEGDLRSRVHPTPHSLLGSDRPRVPGGLSVNVWRPPRRQTGRPWHTDAQSSAGRKNERGLQARWRLHLPRAADSLLGGLISAPRARSHPSLAGRQCLHPVPGRPLLLSSAPATWRLGKSTQLRAS